LTLSLAIMANTSTYYSIPAANYAKDLENVQIQIMHLRHTVDSGVAHQ
jgi:hypothetical protein